eukprot:2875351-Pyramimonas_sp.AAC.1
MISWKKPPATARRFRSFTIWVKKRAKLSFTSMSPPIWNMGSRPGSRPSSQSPPPQSSSAASRSSQSSS